jgi:hypothetical protein
MKAKVFLSAAIVVLFTTTIFSANTQTSEFFFDRKYESGKVISSTRYELKYTGLYEQTQLTTYSYDGENLTKKECFRWDSQTSAWAPVDYIVFSYDILTNSNVLEYAIWNKKENKFNPVSEKAVYQLDILGALTSVVFMKATNHEGSSFESLTAFASKKNLYLAM